MRVSAIVAMAKNRVIGNRNQLPWKLPEDLKRFKQITTGHPVVMGRKTFESIGRLLPNRTNIIVSRQAGYQVEGAEVVSSLEAAVEHCEKNKAILGEEVFIIGGAEIYKAALPMISRFYLTLIQNDFEGDAHLNDLSLDDFQEVAREDRTEPFPFSFLTLERKIK